MIASLLRNPAQHGSTVSMCHALHLVDSVNVNPNITLSQLYSDWDDDRGGYRGCSRGPADI